MGSDPTGSEVSRRSVLASVGAGVAATGLAGQASGSSTGDYIVGMEPGVSTSAATSEARSVKHELDFGDIGRAVAGEFTAEAVERLAARDDVRYVERDGTVRKLGTAAGDTPDALRLAQTLPWGIDRIDADLAHSDGYTGSGADIAVLDTGIDSDHPDLQGLLGTGKAYVNCDTSNSLNTCNKTWDDDEGHGTHCAGTAGAIDNTEGVVGAATQATLHAVKVLDSSGSGSFSDVAAGIKWATDQGHEVISMSLGGSSGTSTLKDACQYAVDNGSLPVAAAGNSGPCTDCVGYPAAYSTVIAVSATGKNDGLAEYSSTGTEVELAAPGGADSDGSGSIDADEAVYSTYPDQTYDYLVGTSMACPHVSGVEALVMSQGATNSEARQILRDTAEDVGLASNEQGYGLVDAEAAAKAVSSPLPHEAGTASVSQPDGKTWHPVSTASSYSDPVVVAGPPTHNGGQPATLRVRNVGSTGFDLQVDEWDYLDGGHISEDVGYLVAEAGTGTVGGAPAEAGHVTTDHNWTSVSFSQSFSNTPLVIPQSVTYNGAQAVTVRVRNVTTSGFELRLQEEPGNNGSHVNEQVDYLAIEPVNATGVEAGVKTSVTDSPATVSVDGFSSTPTYLAAMQTYNGPDTAAARLISPGSGGFDVFVEEEQSGDTETNHIGEDVGYLAINGSSGSELDRRTGTVSTDQPDGTTWHSVSTSASFSKPVVVGGPPSHDGDQPLTLRMRNVSSNGFAFQFDEWDYLDGGHISETTGYAVVEAGTGTVGGAPAEARRVSGVDHNWASVSFSQSFSTAPVVIPQCVTYDGPDAVTVRVKNVSTSGCEIRLQEQESTGGFHTGERVDLLAVEPVNGSAVEAGTTGNRITDAPATVSLDGFSSAPTVLAAMQTYDGPDPCALRIPTRSSSGFDVFVEEEQSATSETLHADENVGYVAFD